jgi:hypothetical protein
MRRVTAALRHGTTRNDHTFGRVSHKVSSAELVSALGRITSQEIWTHIPCGHSSTPIPKQGAVMGLQIRCSVNPGQFSAEYAVTVQAFNGKTYSLFASRQDVECDFPPTEDQSVEGWLSVQPIKHNNKLFLVQLPQSTLENGRFISVSSDQLRSLPGARTA